MMTPKVARPATIPTPVLKKAIIAPIEVETRNAASPRAPNKNIAPVTPSGFFQNDFFLIKMCF